MKFGPTPKSKDLENGPRRMMGGKSPAAFDTRSTGKGK
jgi:hypothetical protein